MEYNVFISHASENEEQVRPLCAYFEDKGLKCFVSYRDIRSGESYPGAITRALRESEMLLLILSKESNASTQVDRELTLANDLNKKMLCFRLDDIAYSDDKAYLMSGVNWLDAFPVPEQHYFELLQDVCRQLNMDVPEQEETEEERMERYERKLGSLLLSASKGDIDAQFDLGVAYDGGNYGLPVDGDEAFRWLMQAAKRGHIKAENSIGYYYEFGINAEENLEEAVKWYRLSALSGNEIAQSNLGYMYSCGRGCNKDIAQAVKWWGLAADQGDQRAQANLGDCYYEGKGVEVDYKKAVALYEKSAAQDNDYAQVQLATCYREGKGVEKNMDKCLEILEIAAKNNSINAMAELASIYYSGVDDIDENQQKSFEYIKMGADRGNSYCMRRLAEYYRNGYGCEVDMGLWFEYLNRAASADNPDSLAQDYLGDIYIDGNDELNIKPDAEKAKQWYQKAIDLDDSDAMIDLAKCYYRGGCLTLDVKKAVDLFKTAADANNARGQYYMSEVYQQGDGVEQNDIEAFNWCLKSAEQEYVPAMSRLGEYYYYGFGTEQNFEKAVEWFNKASSGGDDEAQYHLGLCYEHGYGVDMSYYLAALGYYYSSEKNAKAKDAHERLLEYLYKKADEGDAECQCSIGSYLFYLDDNNKALEYYLKSAEQNYKKAYNQVAWSLHLLNRYDEALPWAEKAASAFPDTAYVIDTLATVYKGLGRYKEAMEQFELYLKLCEGQNEPEENISEAKEKMADLKKLMSKKKSK